MKRKNWEMSNRKWDKIVSRLRDGGMIENLIGGTCGHCNEFNPNIRDQVLNPCNGCTLAQAGVCLWQNNANRGEANKTAYRKLVKFAENCDDDTPKSDWAQAIAWALKIKEAIEKDEPEPEPETTFLDLEWKASVETWGGKRMVTLSATLPSGEVKKVLAINDEHMSRWQGEELGKLGMPLDDMGYVKQFSDHCNE